MGLFQERNKDLHALNESLVDSKLRANGLARGREGSEQERSIMIAGLRRELSLAAAKANSASLLDRVARIGEANRQAAKRRAWAKREEEKEHAYVRGLGRRRGDMILY